ncbi:PAS domain-containing sensor histidine kinase [Fodinibius sp. AD559]|uniref:PAS domain-containing sensor histidine kinase n=1 Tax=Fodinibius sp. AD559 TaxID=3424179 RepID=UPI004046A9C5
MDLQHQEQAYQIASIGHWQLDIVNGQLYWSDQVKSLHEVPLDYQPDLASALAFYADGKSTDKVQTAVDEAIDEGKSFSVEAKIITDKGNLRWVRAVGETVTQDGRCTHLYGSTQDITDRKSLERQLQQERDCLSEAEREKTRILERIDDGFFAVDKDGMVNYWNTEAEQIIGVSQDDIIGRNIWEVFEEATDIDLYDQYHNALNQQVTVQFEEFCDPLDMWIEVTAYPSEGGLSVHFRDITEKKQIRQDLRDKQRQLRNIADNIKGSILRYRLHPDGSDELIYVSEGIKDLHEITPQQAMESVDLIWSQIADDHREELRESIEESAENMTLWDHTFKVETPSGQQKWIHGRGTPRRLEDGSVQWDTIEHDITQQKQLEEQVARQVTLLNHILDSLPGLFFIADEEETFARVNQHTEELFGLSEEELQETNVLEFVAPPEVSGAKDAIQRVYSEGYAEVETILLDGDGREHHYYICGTYFEPDGREYILGSGIDITARVEAEEENSVLLQEVHHRVKNNLAIISGILSMEVDDLPSGSRDREPLEQSINRIHAIGKVHELLYRSSSFSKVSVNEYISDLFNTVMETLQAERDKIDIQLDIPELQMNINEVIPLGMLLNELLTNSLKHAFPDQQQGLITLDITKHQKTYTVTYRDNGRGFEQIDFEESQTLGLTIANILLQQLEADYEIDTEGGFEIAFTFKSRKNGSHANI